MESGTERIHGCFPGKTESDVGSSYFELRDYNEDGTKRPRASSTSGCFGWIRRWIGKKNDLESDNHSYVRQIPEYRDSSTSGCFGWIRRWKYQKAPQNSTRDADSTATGYVNSTATGEGNNEKGHSIEISKDNREMEEAKNEKTRSLEVSEKNQDQWEENEEAPSMEVSGQTQEKVEDQNVETLSLEASELNIKEMSAQEGRPLDTGVEQAHMELEERKTERQMKKLERENRRQRRILKKLTQERGEQLDQEFEPLRMQDALSQKNYMRRIKKQSMRMEELIKKLRGAPRYSTSDADSTANGSGYSPATGNGYSPAIFNVYSTATGESDSDKNEDRQTATFSRGDADNCTLYDRVVHCTELSSDDAVELILKDAEEELDVWRTLKENIYFNFNGRKQNNEARQNMEQPKENQVMEEGEHGGRNILEVPEKNQDQWEKNEEAPTMEVSEENEEKEEDQNGETLSSQASELNVKEMSAREGRPLDTGVEQAHMELEEHKTDRQMKKLEKENRRHRKILKKLTEERGEQLDQEFEPLRMQDALSQKNYMRRIKKQSIRMEELIKKLRGEVPALDEQEMDK